MKTVGGPREKQEGWLPGRYNNPAGGTVARPVRASGSGSPGGSLRAFRGVGGEGVGNSTAAGMGVDRVRVTEFRLERLKGWKCHLPRRRRF